jgi:hypothetical protein
MQEFVRWQTPPGDRRAAHRTNVRIRRLVDAPYGDAPPVGGGVSLYKALSANGNAEFATIMKVIGALGFRLTVARVICPARKRSTTAKRISAKDGQAG